MATLLELTSQGDVGTISDESKLSQVKLMSPQQLYELWERQPWSAHAIDLEQDKEDWTTKVTQEEKDQLAYNLSAFFIGEERVATQFSGLVRSYEDVSEERSEEHTSELQSRQYLVCRLLLEKKKHRYTSCYRTSADLQRSHSIPQYL